MCGGFLRGCGWGASCHSASCAHPLCLVCATLGLHIGVRWISPRCDGIFGMPARTMCKGGWILPVPLGISVTFAPTMCWAGILIDAVGISVILVCRDGMGLCDSRPGLVRPSAEPCSRTGLQDSDLSGECLGCRSPVDVARRWMLFPRHLLHCCLANHASRRCGHAKSLPLGRSC